MSGLLGLLDLGASALAAQNAGVAVSGRNTANVNTAGYTRESVDLQSDAGAPYAGGVRAGNYLRSDDATLSQRERDAAGAQGRSQNMASALSDLEGSVASSSSNVVTSLTSFFSGLSALSATPLDPSARQAFVTQAQQLATQFQSTASAIEAARDASDQRIESTADSATQLAQKIAQLNQSIATSNDPVLADQRDLAARQLVQLVGGQARIDPDGMMRVTVGAGTVLVDGQHAAAVQATLDPALGNHARVDIVDGTHVTDVTTTLDGGQIGGELAFRDGTALRAAGDVDQLAYDLATQVNAVHEQYAGQDGQSGRDLFVQPTAVAGAAAALAVNPDIVADPSKVAAASPGAGSGDNSGALALVALRDQTVAGGGTRTLIDQGIQTLSALGADSKQASDAQDLADSTVDTLKSVRDSVSGVSTDEEISNLAAFQHASEAATRFVSSVNDLLTDFMSKI